jgi:3-deoxy-manno-octulosonate cytidylyltransferase (CMP-KDO synthetase)
MADARPKLIGIIPARWGSTRFPGKPLAELAGKTVIERVVERALSAGVCDAVLVATDDDRIAQAAKHAGAETRMTDSKLANGTLRSHAALVQWEADHATQADWIINVQGDEPFVHPEQLQKLAQLIRKPGAGIATLARPKDADNPERENPNRVKVTCDLNGTALYFSRSPIPSSHGPWLEHVGLYAFSRGALEALTHLHATELEKRESLEQLRWLEHGWKITVGRTMHQTHAVDTPEDLIHLHRLLKSGELN